jgi:hypothetical protein
MPSQRRSSGDRRTSRDGFGLLLRRAAKDVAGDLMAVRRRLIRRLVDELLEKNAIGLAPVPVEQIARADGIDIRYESADDGLSGFLLRRTSAPEEWRAIIGVNVSHHENRRRFSIAHELGHLFLHPGGEVVHVDRDTIFHLRRRDSESAKGTDPEEREANAFAAELLMPETFLQRDLENVVFLDDSDVQGLADRYQVSQHAMTIRLANLGYRID